MTIIRTNEDLTLIKHNGILYLRNSETGDWTYPNLLLIVPNTNLERLYQKCL